MRSPARAVVALVVVASSITLAACTGAVGMASSGTSTSSKTSRSASSGATVGSGVTTWPGSPISETSIPLGDGKLSTSPKVGYEDTCTENFRGGGGRSTLPWINTSAHTWNSKKKISVQGHNSWADARHSFVVKGKSRVLTTNDLPDPGTTGDFPINPSDAAYRYDTNPNSVEPQSFTWTVPARPTAASTPSCTGLGPIGVMTNGVVLFNALDAAGRDAGAHEVQDSCHGHPQSRGIYHYHDFSPCLETAASNRPGSSTLVGYALDGYGIYLERDSHGNLPTNADLNACHGRVSTVMWDGKPTKMFHYDVTLEYPYFVGCFYGTPVTHGPGQ